MVYFSSREVAAISVCAALWSVLSVTVAPLFWQLTHLPFLCDLIGVIALMLALWWARKPGAVFATGVLATIITLVLRPGAVHFFGFTAASLVFDLLSWLSGYERCLERGLLSGFLLLLVSVVSTAVAGVVIGSFFMPSMALARMGRLAVFAGLHALGGLLGGVVGVVVVSALVSRGVRPSGVA